MDPAVEKRTLGDTFPGFENCTFVAHSKLWACFLASFNKKCARRSCHTKQTLFAANKEILANHLQNCDSLSKEKLVSFIFRGK